LRRSGAPVEKWWQWRSGGSGEEVAQREAVALGRLVTQGTDGGFGEKWCLKGEVVTLAAKWWLRREDWERSSGSGQEKWWLG
jgi:hypothetical protein